MVIHMKWFLTCISLIGCFVDASQSLPAPKRNGNPSNERSTLVFCTESKHIAKKKFAYGAVTGSHIIKQSYLKKNDLLVFHREDKRWWWHINGSWYWGWPLWWRWWPRKNVAVTVTGTQYNAWEIANETPGDITIYGSRLSMITIPTKTSKVIRRTDDGCFTLCSEDDEFHYCTNDPFIMVNTHKNSIVIHSDPGSDEVIQR